MTNRLHHLAKKIQEPHDIVDQLNKLFPRSDSKSKKFTLDGRLVGDIGEVIAAEVYGLKLHEKQKAIYDGITKDGQKVQVKCTFKNHLTFKHRSVHYIGLKLYPDGIFKEVYNGPGVCIYDCYKDRMGIEEKLLSFPIAKLAQLSAKVDPKERIEGKIERF